jgi:putative ABC transport system permease protein
MDFLQAFRMAIKSILSNKVRSLLTMLGVIIGVGSVIAAVAFAEGSTKSITDNIQGLGTNLISITITGNRGSNRNVTLQQLQDFADKNAKEIDMIAPQVSGSVTVKSGIKSRTTSLLGTNEDYEHIKNTHVQDGRFIMSFDNDYMQKVAVVGTAVVKDIFDGNNPIGQNIKINGQIFKVVGLLQEKNSSQDSTEDDMVIIPVKVAQRLNKAVIIKNFLVQAAAPETVDIAITKLTELMTNIYNDTTAFRVTSQTQILSTLSSVTGTMMVVLGGIAAISLIVGGIGIMNIMLVSVTERTREIGIRKAIGAKKKNILIQFLIEAAVVTGIGGILGILMGMAIIFFIISRFTVAVYSMEWIVISFGISLVVGIVFGLFPAWKAANLNPIEALRFE